MSNIKATGHPQLKFLGDDLSVLLGCLPTPLQVAIKDEEDASSLLEVVMDLGRLPIGRFSGRDVYIGLSEVTEEDIQYVSNRISPFGDDNRAGIERTLHRISAIRNRSGKVVGLTCRVGRAVEGTVRVIEDLVGSGASILLVGRPGVGKTTMLREMARVLADTERKRVVIVDTSNEIAGDGDIPHPAIGRARRMQVTTPAQQHSVMIEAVENHMPEVIIVDEMGTEREASAARTIAERGVQLVATAHGNTLENLLINPTLSDLVGGVHTVTLSDEEARRRRTQKTILERKAPPTFDVLVEIQSWEKVTVHVDVAQTVDRLLRGGKVIPQARWLDELGVVHSSQQVNTTASVRATQRPQANVGIPTPQLDASPNPPSVTLVYAFGINKDRLEHAARAVRSGVRVVDVMAEADLVLTTKSHFRNQTNLLSTAENLGKPVFVLRRNTVAQLLSFLNQVSDSKELGSDDPIRQATEEANDGVDRIRKGLESSVELTPQGNIIRRIQHEIAGQANLDSRSAGREPRRRVTISKS